MVWALKRLRLTFIRKKDMLIVILRLKDAHPSQSWEAQEVVSLSRDSLMERTKTKKTSDQAST